MTVDDTWAGEVALLRFDEWSTWPHLVTILWLVDEAIATLSQEWADTNPAVAPLLDKVREEVAHTLLFTREWVEIFIYQGPGLQGLVRSVAGALGPQLTRWLGEIGTTRAGHFDSHWQSTVGQGSS